jgi:hypothetical protein
METQSSAPAAAPQKKRNWVPIIVAVVVVVLIAGGAAVLLLRDDSGTEAGQPAGQSAKGLFKAWQDNNENRAARFADEDAVVVLFRVPAVDGRDLQFGGCSQVGDSPWPKECIWSRPGGELTMEVEQGDARPIVTKVTYGPAGLPPDTSPSDTTG